LGVGLAIDGTAVPLQARAVPSFWLFWLFGKAWDGTAVPSFWHFGAQIFFSLRFLESVSDNYLQNNLKQTKSD